MVEVQASMAQADPAGRGDRPGRAGDWQTDASSFLAPYILRPDFPRALRGYSRKAVQQHLQLIVGWTALHGIDDLVNQRVLAADERARKLESVARKEAEQIRESGHLEAERFIGEARREAEEALERARAEAETIISAARQEASAILEEARRAAALQRRGKRRLGRPLGRRE